MRTVDLLFFMGQSNMAGRGDAALAPVVAPGMGYEYRVVTDPDTLHPLEEPFGVNENDPAGVYEPGMKTGAMVSSFVNAWTAQTGVPVVGVSCAKGGSAIAKWLPGTPYYQDAVRRARKARAFLQAPRVSINSGDEFEAGFCAPDRHKKGGDQCFSLGSCSS